MSSRRADPALIPIPPPWRQRRRDLTKPHWSRWQGKHTTCDDCILARSGNYRPEMDLLRALWRVEMPSGAVALVCTPHANRRGRY